MNAIAEQLDHQIQIRYRRWLHADLPGYLRKELSELKASEMTDRFYRHLAMGTEGIRERVGVGSNRINIYTIRRIARALATELEAQGSETLEQGVVIGYDGRLSSRGFAQQAALVLAHCGIRAYLLEQSRPTPQLSCAVRLLEAAAGIVITAGHYPREYSGCKLYGPDGSPMAPEASGRLGQAMAELEDEIGIPLMGQQEALEQGRLIMVGKELDQAYQRQLEMSVPLAKISKNKAAGIGIVFTALHGTGGEALQRMLKRAKYTHVYEVKEQAGPDPFFSTVKNPDPFCPEALEPALELARSVQADIVLAMDPQAQRLSLTIRESGSRYRTLRPDETGALLLDYIGMQIKRRDKSAASGSIYTSVLTGGLADEIAARYGLQLVRTLPGFRHIASAMADAEAMEEWPAVENASAAATELDSSASIPANVATSATSATTGAGAATGALRGQKRLSTEGEQAAAEVEKFQFRVQPVVKLRAKRQLLSSGHRRAAVSMVMAAPPSSLHQGATGPAAWGANMSLAERHTNTINLSVGKANSQSLHPRAAFVSTRVAQDTSSLNQGEGSLGEIAAPRPSSGTGDATSTSAAQPPSSGNSGESLASAVQPPGSGNSGDEATGSAQPQAPAPPFRLAYDESGGCLPADFVRDKDALQTAMLIAEMTAYYRGKKLTLAKRLQQLGELHGYHLEGQVSLVYNGLEGWQRIRNAMEKLRAEPPAAIGPLQVSAVCDYGSGEIRYRYRSRVEPTGLPAGEMIKYQLDGDAWCAVRASSAEPVLTLYYGCRADTAQESRRQTAALRSNLLVELESIL
ncbi:hypothetical protein [Paenibacillus daejeonensis]|uniref:hypothetical protein n=1 Tax=Paenibacillus daejeonensis TaxID=135193 RepID=UPI00037D05C8|nr:hypothetical protein [Paenibacillus daejeonensis]